MADPGTSECAGCLEAVPSAEMFLLFCLHSVCASCAQQVLAEPVPRCPLCREALYDWCADGLRAQLAAHPWDASPCDPTRERDPAAAAAGWRRAITCDDEPPADEAADQQPRERAESVQSAWDEPFYQRACADAEALVRRAAALLAEAQDLACFAGDNRARVLREIAAAYACLAALAAPDSPNGPSDASPEGPPDDPQDPTAWAARRDALLAEARVRLDAEHKSAVLGVDAMLALFQRAQELAARLAMVPAAADPAFELHVCACRQPVLAVRAGEYVPALARVTCFAALRPLDAQREPHAHLAYTLIWHDAWLGADDEAKEHATADAGTCELATRFALDPRARQPTGTCNYSRMPGPAVEPVARPLHTTYGFLTPRAITPDGAWVFASSNDPGDEHTLLVFRADAITGAVAASRADRVLHGCDYTYLSSVCADAVGNVWAWSGSAMLHRWDTRRDFAHRGYAMEHLLALWGMSPAAGVLEGTATSMAIAPCGMLVVELRARTTAHPDVDGGHEWLLLGLAPDLSLRWRRPRHDDARVRAVSRLHVWGDVGVADMSRNKPTAAMLCFDVHTGETHATAPLNCAGWSFLYDATGGDDNAPAATRRGVLRQILPRKMLAAGSAPEPRQDGPDADQPGQDGPGQRTPSVGPDALDAGARPAARVARLCDLVSPPPGAPRAVLGAHGRVYVGAVNALLVR